MVLKKLPGHFKHWLEGKSLFHWFKRGITKEGRGEIRELLNENGEGEGGRGGTVNYLILKSIYRSIGQTGLYEYNSEKYPLPYVTEKSMCDIFPQGKNIYKYIKLYSLLRKGIYLTF